MPPQIDFSKYGLAQPTPTAGKIDFSKYGLGQSNVPKAPPISANRMADIETAKKYGSTFTPSTENQGFGIGEAMKTVGNIPKSAFNFVKSSIDLMNPISTFGKVKQAVGEFKGLAGEAGGYGKAFGALGRELPQATYEGLVPEAPRGLIKGVGGLITGNALKEKEGFEQAQRAITADPVGQIGIPLLIGRGIAGKMGYGGQYDTAISKTAQVITKPVGAVLEGAKNLIGGSAKFATGQATGLQPETISQITKNPENFTKEAQGMIDRSSLGREVQSVLGKKKAILSETGEAYAPIREGDSTVKVSSNWLDSTIKDLTNLDIKKGKIKTSGSAVLREASDVRAMQHIYDLWKPIFKKGEMTADEFLNFRTDLANLSKFERQIGKSQPIESMAKLARGRFNESYRPQLEGLEALDKEFSAQTGELSRLSKGFIDKNGNLTDAAINRIANATGKGKDILLNRLEETVPGITQKIKVLKAVEDIQNASGIKVGTYGRTAGTIGGGALGYAFGGPIGAGIGAIVESILTSPNLAVPILRKYGLIKNSAAIQTVVNALRSAGSTINQLPNQRPPILKKDIREIKTPAGMSIEDVSKGKPPTGAFSPKGQVGMANPIFNKEKFFQKQVFKYKTHTNYMENKYNGFAEASGLDRMGLGDQTIKWLDDWFGAKQTHPPKEAIQQLSKYKPKEPVTIYSGNSIDRLSTKRIEPTSFTSDLGIAKTFGDIGRRDNPAIIKIEKVNPQDIAVAIDMIPKEIIKTIASDKGFIASESEIITNGNIGDLAKKYKTSISKDGGKSWAVVSEKSNFGKSISQLENESAIAELKSKFKNVEQKNVPVSEIRNFPSAEGRDIVENAKNEILEGKRFPLVLEKITEGKNAGKYKVIDGNYRVQAYKELGIKDAPAITGK